MKNSSEHSELIHLTTHKLTGEASRDELSRLDELLLENRENQRVHSELIRTWDGTEKAAGFTQEDTDEEWERLKNSIQNEQSSGNSFSFLKIAATIVLAIGVGLSAYFLNQDNATHLVAQQVQTEVLEDGSTITLNAATELSFSSDYGKEKREVNLTGEAFFDIEKDIDRPFIIHTPSVDVKVIGTSFTLRVLPDEPTAEVVVTDGTVEVSYRGKVIKLEVGEKGILDKNSRQLFKVFNDNINFMAWKTKIFVFNDVLLEDVIEILNNAYQSSVYIKGTEIAKCPVTVSFEEKSLDSILQVLTTTLNLSIWKTGNGTELSGSGC
ncbi:MAG: FecR domain-containing protein [Cyclobacteriaceae bacterium]